MVGTEAAHCGSRPVLYVHSLMKGNESMMRRGLKRAALIAAAAATAMASIPVLDVSAATSLAVQKDKSYTAPMSDSRTSDEYKKFVSSAPKLSFSSDYYYSYSACLTWTEVDNAMLYYVYVKEGKSFRLIGKTVKPSISLDDTDLKNDYSGKEFMVRAVTYSVSDRRILSADSNVCQYKRKQILYEYEDEDAVEEEPYYAPVANTAVPATSGSTKSRGYALSGMYYPENTEEYTHYEENNFKKASDSPLSTISADVDTAAYAHARYTLSVNSMPDADSVRTEEFLNYFDYNYLQPKKEKFTVTYELSECPWNSSAQLLMLGIQTKDLEKEPDSNLVFLIDVSGSMYSANKLDVVADSLKQLSGELSSDDTISIVTYSGDERVVVSGAKGNMKNCISDIADSLIANGSTNGEAGINMAYEIAADHYIKDGSNRVILATDGDLNVGISDTDELSKFIEKKRDTGVYLTVLGVGAGNLKDNKMEALAKNGNGNYHYIDSAAEASKVLVEERQKTLVPAADDVKFQVEFNPVLVDSYRLVGYEGRRLENEDFANDKKDAADIGAGQSVTVMYEIKRTNSPANTLKYQKSTGNKTDLCTVSLRYKDPGAKQSKLAKVIVKADQYCKYDKAGVKFKFATCVAETAMYMRGDTNNGNVSLVNAQKRLSEIDSKELATIGYSDDFRKLLGNAVSVYSGSGYELDE